VDASLFRLSVFAVTAIPLVVQDRQTQSVSQTLLLATVAVWVGAGLLYADAEIRVTTAAAVLVCGILFLVLLPERLGEADVLFAAGMACLLPFWTWLTAMIAACGGGLVAFGWLAWKSGASIRDIPIPFLPCLYWGGFSVLLKDVFV